jgi:hypothetical protein
MARATRRIEAERGVESRPIEVLIFMEMLKAARNRPEEAMKLLMAPGKVSINGNPLVPTEAGGLIYLPNYSPVESLDLRVVGQVPDWRLPLMMDAPVDFQDDAPFVINMAIGDQDQAKIVAGLKQFGVERKHSDIVHSGSNLQAGYEVVSPQEIAKLLNLHPGRVQIQAILDDGKTPGAMRLGRVTVFPVLPVVRNMAVVDLKNDPSFSDSRLPLWQRMGFTNYEDWVVNDPLLVQFDVAKYSNYPGLRQLVENANRAMVNAVRLAVSSLSDANLDRYIADVVVGKDPDLEWVRGSRVQNMVDGIKMLQGSIFAAVSAIESLMMYQLSLVEASRGAYSAFHPQELALAAAAVNDAFYRGMEVSNSQINLATRGGVSRGQIVSKLDQDWHSLQSRLGRR